MLIPIFGELITSIGLLLCTHFKAAPVEVVAVTETLFNGLTGGWFTMLMGVFSYVADITTKEKRTLRIGIVNLCISLGVPVGMAFSGVLLKQIGFYGMFSLAAAMHFSSLMYGIFGVSEPTLDVADHAKKTARCEAGGRRSLLADFFDKEHVVETFRVAFKSGARQRRLRVIMLIIVVMVVDGPLYGECGSACVSDNHAETHFYVSMLAYYFRHLIARIHTHTHTYIRMLCDQLEFPVFLPRFTIVLLAPSISFR